MHPAMGDSVNQSVPDFQTFYRGWITRLELYLDQLLNVLQFQDHENESKLHVQQLVHSVMTHYHDYFLAKAKLSGQNIFLVLSPPWFSSYERTFLWLAGFKPGLAFNVVNNCGIQLSTGQSDMMDRLTAEIKNEENAVTKRLARYEQQVVSPPMLALAKIQEKEVNGMVHDIDTMVELLADDMECLVSCADHLRGKTVAKVVGILTTAQSVRFFAGLAQLQLRIRRWGQLREDADRSP
ncbi:DOG1 domain-containing protein [Artemisia annua]|uniref:DOG1 domain-containing protein n=1 Tax=Artemisia annua TaxID=35608 RepID=A0A2U1LDH6_ARTAN|nr:DOG1 domain-containing protein [Artemisia annua]